MSTSVEIICIGTELLIGKTLNTNAHWLAKRINSLGLNVRRITNVPDEIDEMSQVIQETLQRKPLFVITCGGLGPTFDDKTLEGVAKALGCKTEVNKNALKMIEEKYKRYVKEGLIKKIELTPPRIKMARLPKGAKPLSNPVGTAPGVITKHEETTIIALPGVPSEMMAIFEDSVVPVLKVAAGDKIFFETSLNVRGVMESDIAPLIDRAMHNNPYIYVKSHPSHTGEKVPHLELHLSTTAENSNTAKNRVSRALIQLSELIKQKGGKIKVLKAKTIS
jgi:molybdenum cofactor synthesis domain-containing protein